MQLSSLQSSLKAEIDQKETIKKELAETKAQLVAAEK
jgi:hypothetical protein